MSWGVGVAALFGVQRSRALARNLLLESSMFITLLTALIAPALADTHCGPDSTLASDVVHILDAGAPVTPGRSTETGHRPGDARMARVYDDAAGHIETMGWRLRGDQMSDLESFYANWRARRARYEEVARRAGLPAPLVAAIHWRESTGDFNTYLHQGDRLGRPAVHVPRDIPVFHDWTEAAVHALDMKSTLREAMRITTQTTDLAALATYAEHYNGLGYHYRGRPSPYVFSGTDQYSRGKFVRDGVYSSRTRDRQLGVVAMIQYIRAMEGGGVHRPGAGPAVGDRPTLRRGALGDDVERLQAALREGGYYSRAIDGDFGWGTWRAVRAFQRDRGLDVDGTAGPSTWEALQGGQPMTS